MTTNPRSTLISDIVAALEARADPARAGQQQRYMKSALPFYGVTAPEVRKLTKQALRDHPIESRGDFEWVILSLWDNVTHREHWYAALTIATARKHQEFIDAKSLALFRHLIESGAWWDVVDDVATHLVGPLVRSTSPGSRSVVAHMRDWAREDSIWIARTAIICQVGAKADVDAKLLAEVIEPNLERKEFFVRKAIGWALRDYSRTAPDWVKGYVETHRSRLSALSVREATKHLDP